MMKRTSIITGVLSVMLIMGTVSCKKAPEEKQKTQPPAVVGMMVIEQKDIPYSAEFVGITEGSKNVEVRAQVSGILRETVFQEGYAVNKGDVLFHIEPETYEAAYSAAIGNLQRSKAELVQAKQEFERINNLYKTNSISKRDYDKAYASYESAKAGIKSAEASVSDSKIKLGYTKVVAPVSGYTSNSVYTIGNLISANSQTPLTTINQVNPIHVKYSIPANIMTNLRLLAANGKVTTEEQLTSTLYTSDDVKYPFTGKVIFFDKSITRETGDIKIKAEFENPDMALLPGQYVRATLNGFTLKNSIVIPQKAIVQRQGTQMVIVVDSNNVAHFTPVKLGMNLGNNYLVESGLKNGDRIVVEGTNKVMRDNSSVMDAETFQKVMQQKQPAK